MKITNNYNMPNFKGYKNLISFDQEAQGNRLALFVAQLNNNDTPDLDNYKKLADYPRCFNKGNIDDTIMCVYSETPNHHVMYLNNDLLLNANELDEVARKFSQKDFLQVEKGYLKAYTQIANLTKQIMNNNTATYRDMGIHKIITEAKRMLTNLCGDDSQAALRILETAFYNVNHQKTAFIINAGVNKALKNYF